MEFIKSWKFMAVLVAVLALVSLAGVIYGVVTHEEPGFMSDVPRWDPGQFPLRVCSQSWADADAMGALIVVENAAERINNRLGFQAYVLNYAGDHCDVRVVVGVPSEPDWMDPGGDALLTTSAGGTSCDVRISNVHGEVRGLVVYHELGHCLGLAHDQDQTSIMRPVPRPTPDGEFSPWISDHDRALLRGAYMRTETP